MTWQLTLALARLPFLHSLTLAFIRLLLDHSPSQPVDACTSETRRRANTSASVSTAGTLSPESTNADLPPASIQDIASGLQIHQQGTLTPQSALIEFSLMSKTAKFDRVDAYDKMFFSQSPSMYLARHSKGSFGSYEDIKLREMRVSFVSFTLACTWFFDPFLLTC